MNKRLGKTLIKANKHRKMHLIALNKILFKGKSHSKRGRGLLKLPKIGGRDPLSPDLRSYCNQELLSIILRFMVQK